MMDGARIEKGSGNLDRLCISADEGEAHVYLHGAHVAHFQPHGSRPVLFVSKRSHFESGTPGKAIRGGIPICFPWFGPKAGSPSAPQHGFARVLPWTLDEVTRNGKSIQATLRLEASDFTRRLFPYDFSATFVVTVGAQLTMELIVDNTGSEPMPFEEALHTYFSVGDARRISIGGLEGAPYLDKTDALAQKSASSAPFGIDSEVDRVFTGSKGTATITDPAGGRRIIVRKSGSGTTVVWNPWTEKAKGMADFGEDEWKEMVCVETANAMDSALTIRPGAIHAMNASIEVEAI